MNDDRDQARAKVISLLALRSVFFWLMTTITLFLVAMSATAQQWPLVLLATVFLGQASSRSSIWRFPRPNGRCTPRCTLPGRRWSELPMTLRTEFLYACLYARVLSWCEKWSVAAMQSAFGRIRVPVARQGWFDVVLVNVAALTFGGKTVCPTTGA